MKIFFSWCLLFFSSCLFAADCSDVFPASETENSATTLDVPNWSSTTDLTRTRNSDTFAPGDYYYRAGTFSGQYDLLTTGASTRLYFTSLTISGGDFNPGGDPEDLIIIVDGTVTIAGNPEINAIIYATNVAILSGTYTINGAITAEGSIISSGNGSINYDADAVENADFGVLCSSSPGGSSSIGVRISDNDDDVEERISDGDMYFDSSDLEMAHDSFRGGVQRIGLLFRGLSIPPGSTITNAYVEFTADRNHSGNTNLVIYGEADATPDDFSNSDFDVRDRIKTTASVNWQPGSWSDDNLYATDDITAIIQEIVDIGDWASGNNLVIIIEPGSGCSSSSCRRRAESHDGDSSRAASLVVEFTPPEIIFPEIEEIYACTLDDQILVSFDGDLPAEASDSDNYTINNGVVINTVTVLGNDLVQLSVTGLDINQSYTLEISSTPIRSEVFNPVDSLSNGIQAEYYDQRSGAGGAKVRRYGGLFTGNVTEQTDSQIDFNWGGGEPVTSVGNDDFSVRWEGYILISSSGNHRFRTRSDDGVRLWINGTQVINNWTDHGPRYDYSGNINFSAGEYVHFQMEMYERGGGAVAQLQWDPPGSSWQTIPDSSLFSCGSVPVFPLLSDIETSCNDNSKLFLTFDEEINQSLAENEANYSINQGVSVISASKVGSDRVMLTTSPMVPGNQYLLDILRTQTQQQTFTMNDGRLVNGLVGTYFDQRNAGGSKVSSPGGVFTGTETVLIDQQLNFDWGNSEAIPGIGGDDFSIRWEGFVSVPESGLYRFRTRSDDGVRLYLDEQLIIENWTNHPATNNDSSLINLNAGEYYPIRMEFYERGGQAVAQLFWDSPSGNWEIIPGANLFHCEPRSLDHLEISVSTASASTCAPIQVTVRACQDDAVPCTTLVDDYEEQVTLDVSRNRGDWSVSDVQGTLANGIVDDGVASYQFVDADDGDAVFNLNYIYADQIRITVNDSVNNLSATSELVTFSDNAFVMSWDDAIHPTVDGSDPTVAVAGRPHALNASYVRRDPATGDCGVVSSYDGDDRSVAVWFTPSAAFNATQTLPSLRDEGDSDTVSLPSSQPASANFNLDFVNGVADLALLTTDVGQFSLSIQDKSDFVLEEGGDSVDVLGSSSQATVRPFGFALDIGDDCSGTAGDRSGGSNASVVSSRNANGTAYIAAGVDFPLTVKAVRWDASDDSGNDGVPDDFNTLHNNACLPSFGSELSSESVDLSIANSLPDAVTSTEGALSVTTITGFSGGIRSTPMNYSEVGIIDVDASLTSYLGVPGANVAGQLYDLGRFFPYQFEVTDSAIDLVDGHEAGWSCDFTYQGQDFRFDDDIELVITAQNFQGATTQNYEGSYWKLIEPAADAPNVISKASVSHGLGLDESSVTVAFSFTPGAADANGQGTLTFSDDLRITYLRQAGLPDGDDVPFQAMVDWVLASEYLDDTPNMVGAIQESCYRVDGSCADYSIIDITNGLGNTNIRYGRAVVGNNAGSELMNLELSLQTQQWLETASSSGQYSFVANDEDTCSDDDLGGPSGGWADEDITLSGFQGNLSSSDTNASFTSFDGGLGVLTLTAPGSGNEGSVNVTFAVDDWLKYDFYQRGDEDPTGTATFGIFSGRQPIFYLRESYR